MFKKNKGHSIKFIVLGVIFLIIGLDFMNNMFTVEQVMAKKIVSISPETTIKEAAQILSTKEFHALPVCEGELLVGIVTTTDLIKYLIDQY